MLGDTIKQVRMQKGMTQEALAVKLHLVRQTVSKWEKNLSVPDARMLGAISEVLEVSVSHLLGRSVPEDNTDQLALQLMRINEELAVRNRRARRIWTVLGIALLALAALVLLLVVLGLTGYSNYAAIPSPVVSTVTELTGG